MDIDDKKLIKLFQIVSELKNIRRAGWVRAGIPETEVESVADHTFRTVFLAMVFGDILNLNSEKLMKMALLHDLAEVHIGDITPYDEITTKEKRDKESKAIRDILSDIPNNDEYLTLWHEFEQQVNDEAILIKNLDKLEMALQTAEYQTKFADIDLSEFFVDAEKQLNIPEVRKLFDRIKSEMDK